MKKVQTFGEGPGYTLKILINKDLYTAFFFYAGKVSYKYTYLGIFLKKVIYLAALKK